MANAYNNIAFTKTVKARQSALGSRKAYAEREDGATRTNDRLGPAEAAFLTQRQSFYMATVNDEGWPYVQHRGGPEGFLRVLDDRTIGFADFSGNRQYVSLGNLGGDDRVSLFLMDYANRRRLKMFGRAEVIDPADGRFAALPVSGYRARIERGILINVTAFDWNCPQHIPELFTLEDVQAATSQLTTRVRDLEAALAASNG